jgi:hypothetical protein
VALPYRRLQGGRARKVRLAIAIEVRTGYAVGTAYIPVVGRRSKLGGSSSFRQ